MNRYGGIFQYVSRLCAETGCQVMIKDFVGFAAHDPGVASGMNPFCIHKSPYCLFLKNHEALWDSCHRASERLHRRCMSCEEGERFTGMCYAGFSEFILPVFWEKRLIACICAGGFELDRAASLARLRQVCQTNGLDEGEALREYDRSLTMTEPVWPEIEEGCGVLADFLRMYYTALVKAGDVNPDVQGDTEATLMNILTNSLEYIHMNYSRDIHLRDVAAFCGCSESYLSHMFKRNMNNNISCFINRVRVEQAQRLIAEGSAKMHQIAARCGFSDPNYFSTVFFRHVGMPPTAYRKLLEAERSKR